MSTFYPTSQLPEKVVTMLWGCKLEQLLNSSILLNLTLMFLIALLLLPTMSTEFPLSATSASATILILPILLGPRTCNVWKFASLQVNLYCNMQVPKQFI